MPGIENVGVEGLVGVVGAEAAGRDKTRGALERSEEHLIEGTHTKVSPTHPFILIRLFTPIYFPPPQHTLTVRFENVVLGQPL